ncbi:uncharacterized protein LOC125659233 [Ostrea edulis]|uniref:uncharacterized protein LOC125659233 n=1 Tax=Ostrea edulis TaxID=37623 RepID=UPI0024AF139D|nr:uncharacterized protein LOC125659233 [Ostrea edulis]
MHVHLLPKITTEQIEAYFIFRLAGDKYAASDVKALVKGRLIKDADRILACSILMQGGQIYFSGIVAAAMKKLVTYNYKIKIEKESGDPVNSECECPSGKGPHGTCKHLAAVFIVLEEFVQTGNLSIQKTCTENLQTFHRPKALFKGSPVKVEDMKTSRSNICFDDPRPLKYRCMEGYNDHVRNVLINYMSDSNTEMAFKYLMPKADLQAAVQDHDYLKQPYTEYWIDEALKVDRSSINAIEKATRGQATNKKWFSERSWRITASRFGEISKITPRRNIKKLLQRMLKCKSIDTAATLHGKNYEKKALKAFEKYECVKTKQCGLFISHERPYLGASPDAVVDNKGIVEVKCPFTGRKDKILPGKNFSFLQTNEEGQTVLRKSHPYYDQIQGQLYISGHSLCYFVVYTFSDLFVEKLFIDQDYCENALIPKLELFYVKHFRPSIAANV